MDPHDVQIDMRDIGPTSGPFLSDAPPSPGTTSAGASAGGGNYMRTSSGKRIDRRLWVFAMVAAFTSVLLVFSMVMICLGHDEGIWLPVMTFAVGVWTGQLPGNYQSGGSSSSGKHGPKSPSSLPAQ